MLVGRVADRHLIRLAARQAFAERRFQKRAAALPGLTPEVVAAFAEGFYLPMHEGRVAFAGVLKKVQQLVKAFTQAPRLWAKFKEMLGVESLSELPKAIVEFAKKGYAALKGIIQKAFEKWPLKLYTLPKGKMAEVGDLIDSFIKSSPTFARWVAKAKAKVNQFDEWLREYLPTLSRILLVAVYMWIWFNVTEFEWNLKSLTEAILGNLSLADLLASLPSSGVGFLLNAFNFGTFTLLPYTIAARVLFMLANRYIEWTGSGFRLNREALAADFGLPDTSIPATV